MNLGILRVASVLENAGYPVEVVDLSGVDNFLDAIRDHARTSAADTFGLTATTPQLPAASRVAEAIRDVRPGARLILGGPHVTLVCAASRREARLGYQGRGTSALDALKDRFDVLVAGDGEEAIFCAIGDDPPHLIDADNPKSPLFLSSGQLAELPFPARHLVDVDSYRYYVDGARALSLIAQLGCPFECGFCGGRESPSFRRARMRPTESVVAEVVHLHKTYGLNGFMLYDDELNVNRKMVELMLSLARVQRELGTEFRLRGFVKAELFTDEQADAMRRAGFRWILTGFESGSPRILQNINKKATRDDNTRCVEIARRHGLKVKALMSIGHPGESAETIQETHDWLLHVKPDDFDLTIITTYPGTPYYDRAIRHPDRPGTWIYEAPNGDRLFALELDYTKTADYYKGDPNGGYQAFVYTDDLSCVDLVEHRDRVEREVREVLGIPFNPSAAAIRYEHSMGQQRLPANLLRTSGTAAPAAAWQGASAAPTVLPPQMDLS